MGIKDKMTNTSMTDPLEKVYREERAYRADRLVEKWAKVPELGSGLKNMNEGQSRNLAILLENQARIMSKMTEAQLSTNFYGLRTA